MFNSSFESSNFTGRKKKREKLTKSINRLKTFVEKNITVETYSDFYLTSEEFEKLSYYFQNYPLDEIIRQTAYARGATSSIYGSLQQSIVTILINNKLPDEMIRFTTIEQKPKIWFHPVFISAHAEKELEIYLAKNDMAS